MKRMLIDDTQPEETRVVIVDGNKVEDVEFESSLRKQIKGNIFTAKVVRIEPSLQAAFVDYGGNRHGFLAFGEIHPDYYNVSDEIKAEVEKEVDEIIEKKRQFQAERKAEQERRRLEREQKRAEYEAKKLAEAEAEAAAAANAASDTAEMTSETPAPAENASTAGTETPASSETAPGAETEMPKTKPPPTAAAVRQIVPAVLKTDIAIAKKTASAPAMKNAIAAPAGKRQHLTPDPATIHPTARQHLTPGPAMMHPTARQHPVKPQPKRKTNRPVVPAAAARAF